MEITSLSWILSETTTSLEQEKGYVELVSFEYKRTLEDLVDEEMDEGIEQRGQITLDTILIPKIDEKKFMMVLYSSGLS